ncbi:MFS transporter [Carboxydocella sp. JDF658]|uniref:MFS transporter n=1 Tax=Carboxydocella sp. JDF658 TaxID=1926600 RepID=UPI0009AC7C68|nr:MFS transporter [Carboxydocella sp. JDF658]GAW31647.1 MFS transporter [Carboxydocella sp. JDF658]
MGESREVASKTRIQAGSREYLKANIALSIGGMAVFANLHFTQPLLPLFTREFGVKPAETGLTVSAVIFTLSVFMLVFGTVSDAWGRKKIMAAGLLLTALLAFAAVFVQNFPQLVLLRALQGVFLAALPALGYAYIGEEYEQRAVAAAIGMFISSNSIGGMGGRIISGVIADYWGWRYAFLVLGGLCLLGYVLFLWWLPPSRHFRSRPFSGQKALAEIKEHWSNPVLRNAFLLGGMILFVFVGLFNYLGFRLQQAPYYFSATATGFLYLTYLAGTFSSTLSGRLDGRLTIPQRILTGLVLMSLGLVMMILKPLFLIVAGLIFFCFGFFFAHAATSNWVSRKARQARAAASALYLLCYYLGGTAGGYFLGYVWQWGGWLWLSAVCFFMLLAAMVVNRQLNRVY